MKSGARLIPVTAALGLLGGLSGSFAAAGDPDQAGAHHLRTGPHRARRDQHGREAPALHLHRREGRVAMSLREARHAHP